MTLRWVGEVRGYRSSPLKVGGAGHALSTLRSERTVAAICEEKRAPRKDEGKVLISLSIANL